MPTWTNDHAVGLVEVCIKSSQKKGTFASPREQVRYGNFRKFPQAEQRAEGAFMVRGP